MGDIIELFMKKILNFFRKRSGNFIFSIIKLELFLFFNTGKVFFSLPIKLTSG